MKRIFPSISWYGWGLLAILLLSSLLLVSLVLVGTGDSSQTEDFSQADTEAADFQGGRTAWLDPVTGKLSKEKPPEGIVLPLDDQTLRQFSTSDVDLTPRTLDDGTEILDLQGRFRQGSVATVDNDGEVKIHRIGGEMFLSEDGRDIQRRLHESNTSSDDNQP